jgi:hypothetical protein
MAATGHHAEDVGKILMGVQSDLRSLRSDISAAATAAAESGAGSSSRQVAALQRIVDRAETDIRLKTEAVLQSALNDQYTTLPAIRETKRSKPAPQVRPSSAQTRMTAKEQNSARRQMDMLLKPTTANARTFLQERFGVAAPASDHSQKRPGAKVRAASLLLP